MKNQLSGMSNWLCILNRENFGAIREKCIWGVSKRHRKKLMNTKLGDLCAFYLVGEGTGKNRIKPAIGGVFKIISVPYEDQLDIFPSKRSSEEIYPYRVKISAIKLFEPELIFEPLIPHLSFIKNKQKYSGHVIGKAMLEIPEEDMGVIMDYKI
jgi:predicted RNA-binding protein